MSTDIRDEPIAFLTRALMKSANRGETVIQRPSEMTGRRIPDACPRPSEYELRNAISRAVAGLTTQYGEAVEQLTRAEYGPPNQKQRLERIHHARGLVENMLDRIKDAEAVVARAGQ